MTSGLDTIGRESEIIFPFLGDLTLDPPASFSLFGREIYFYGVIVALAFLAALLYAARTSKRFGIRADDVYDLMLFLLPLGILGARCYYVLFRLDYYLQHPGEILALWEGGLAIYGGILAGALTVFLFCKKKRISAFAMLDLVSLSCLLGQAIGRWGNFFNREAFGAETEIFCRMGLTDASGQILYVHPTFLYESLWNLLGFLLLNLWLRAGKRKYDGQCLLLYLVWYGCGRAGIEGLRTDSLMLGATGIRVSQALSILLALFGIFMLIYQNRKNRGSASASEEE